MIDTKKDTFSRNNALKAISEASASLGMQAPELEWSNRAKNGRYCLGTIQVGPRCWRGWYVLVHEFAHHIHEYAFPYRLTLKRADHHGPEFRESLELAAAVMLGDPKAYAWGNEYRLIARWAKKKGY